LKGENITTSIIKIKGKKDKDGIQAYIVRINRKVNGKYLQKDKTIYGKDNADAYKLNLDTALKSNTLIIDKFTVKQVYDRFIDSKRMRTKERSVDRIKQEFELYILPTFENTYIDEITPVMIENWMLEINKRKKHAKYRKLANKPLAIATKKSIFMFFKQLFNYAMKYDYISKNPFTKVDNFRDTEKLPPITDFYTQEQATLFLETAKKYAEKQEKESKDLSEWNYYVWFALAIGTGARRGEIHGFQWNDIEGDTIYVRRSLCQKKKYRDSISVKTDNSIRRIPLSNSLRNILNEHKKRMKKLDGFKDEYRICNNIKDSSIVRRRNKYADAVDLKKIRIHDFRHSFVSHLYFAGVDDDIIKEFVGHSTTEMTKKYKHLHPLQRARAEQVLANMIL